MVILYILFLLCFGSMNTLTTKWQFNLTSVGIDGLPKQFQKPWWGNFAMFVAMIAVLLVYAVEVYNKKREKKVKGVNPDGLLAAADGAVAEQEASSASSSKKLQDFMAVALPSVLDLLSSGLNFMGLLYINASVWQMLRGSMIIFSALLSIMFLKREMMPFHWVGIGMCVVGISCVGASSVLGSEATASADADASSAADSSAATIGVLLVMIAQVIQAGQIVAEERLLKHVNLPGTLIVGYEGVWGAAIMAVVVFPLLAILPGSDTGGVQENTFDTLVMIENNSNMQIMLCIYLFSCATYNVARMLVTSTLSAVHFTMIDASRTALIWVLDLCIFYAGPAEYRSFGE